MERDDPMYYVSCAHCGHKCCYHKKKGCTYPSVPGSPKCGCKHFNCEEEDVPKKLKEKSKAETLVTEDCPFCGSVGFSNNHVAGRHYIVCTSCGAIGPKTDDSDNAIRLWNMRGGVLS